MANGLNELRAITTQVTATEIKEVSPPVNGTGLMIFFHGQSNESYLLAGIRTDKIEKVLTVNGGKVDDASNPLFNQLKTELEEETFGAMRLEGTHPFVETTLKVNGEKYPISFAPAAHILSKPGIYTYVTFSADTKPENTPSLSTLRELAGTLSGTASFFNKIGNLLFGAVQALKAQKTPESFQKFWLSVLERNLWLIDFNNPDNVSKQALGVLESKFKMTPPELVTKLTAINSQKDLQEWADRIGDYSERSSYHIFNAANLYEQMTNQTPILNVDGAKVADAVMNEKAFKLIWEDMKKNYFQPTAASFPFTQSTTQQVTVESLTSPNKQEESPGFNG